MRYEKLGQFGYIYIDVKKKCAITESTNSPCSNNDLRFLIIFSAVPSDSTAAFEGVLYILEFRIWKVLKASIASEFGSADPLEEKLKLLKQ